MSTPEPPDVDRLRAAWRSLEDEPGWPDADAERAFTALHGEMSAEERRAVIAELVKNPNQAAAWRLARELEAEMPAQPIVSSSRRDAYRWLAVAATLVLVAGVAAWQFQSGREDVPVYRSADTRALASRLPPDVRLSRAEPVLKWTPIEGAAYRVRVFTPELDLLEESQALTTPEYRLSVDVLSGIPPAGRILWQVEAEQRGTSPVVSPTFSTQIE